MKYNLIIVAFLICIVSSCKYDSDQLISKSGSNLIIKTGTICGWCAVNDTLTIDNQSVRYVNYAGCGTLPSNEQNGVNESSELNDLLGKLDFGKFKKLNLNTCNVCVDGCDDWLLIQSGTELHTIRFGKDDPEIVSIKSFLDELYLLKSRYSAIK